MSWMLLFASIAAPLATWWLLATVAEIRERQLQLYHLSHEIAARVERLQERFEEVHPEPPEPIFPRIDD